MVALIGEFGSPKYIIDCIENSECNLGCHLDDEGDCTNYPIIFHLSSGKHCIEPISNSFLRIHLYNESFTLIPQLEIAGDFQIPIDNVIFFSIADELIPFSNWVNHLPTCSALKYEELLRVFT